MRDNILETTGQIMREVVFALVLGILAIFYFFGFGIFFQIILAVATALLVEGIFLRWRKMPVAATLSDGSAIISAVLLALSIPTIAPWWVAVLGAAFAMVFGKHLYGGLGNNPFNPAMLGYAFLLISYPLEMTRWQAPGFIHIADSALIIFSGYDAQSGATVLDAVKNNFVLQSLNEPIFVRPDFWVNIGFLAGGLYLLRRGWIEWQIPASLLLAVFVVAFSLHFFGDYPSPVFHLLSGATMLGAFFIATDPVSASTTPAGRLIYGALIGVLIVVIRTFGGYPDGVAFAVLLMNLAVPLIDAFTLPRIFGKKRK